VVPVAGRRTGLVQAASFAGDLHGLGDSLAVFRTAIIIGCIAVASLVWRWRVAQGVIAACAIIWAHQIMDGRFSSAPTDIDFVIYQKNLLYFERDRSAFIEDVIASGADVVTLQEVSPVNEVVLDQLRAQYPHQLFCNARNVRKNAILSRTRLNIAECNDQSGFARVVTQVRGRSVQVYGLHLYWPYPYRQRAQGGGDDTRFKGTRGCVHGCGG
jgi:endonuclease/exonuclease/phosphatase (EEP) superfamily protein YafD